MLKTLMKSMNSTLNKPPEYTGCKKNLRFPNKNVVLTNFKENSFVVTFF